MGIEGSQHRCAIRVRWSEYKGYVMMQNPLDGRVYLVEAGGLPKWVFERLQRPGEPGDDRGGTTVARPVTDRGGSSWTRFTAKVSSGHPGPCQGVDLPDVAVGWPDAASRELSTKAIRLMG